MLIKLRVFLMLEDVPGYMEGEGYALFNYDEGLSYVTK